MIINFIEFRIVVKFVILNFFFFIYIIKCYFVDFVKIFEKNKIFLVIFFLKDLKFLNRGKIDRKDFKIKEMSISSFKGYKVIYISNDVECIFFDFSIVK